MGKSNNFRHWGIAGMALCALCCLLPIVIAVTGLGVLASLTAHLEKLAIGFLALGAISFGIYLFRKRKSANKCATDCGCKTCGSKETGTQPVC